eukprot:1546135-Alexandrium_andersonii.AAC.1
MRGALGVSTIRFQRLERDEQICADVALGHSSGIDVSGTQAAAVRTRIRGDAAAPHVPGRPLAA